MREPVPLLHPVQCMTLQVMIVDDNPKFLQAARRLLEQEGLAVVAVAATGAEAVARAAALHPDVALVDIDLGEESGFDVTARLARPGVAPAVILISAYAQQDFESLLGSSPAVGFIAKAQLSAAAIRDLLPDAGVRATRD
jgi:CheY-like chemotaxis protein